METFGGQQMRLLGTERIRTGNNCVPRDIVQVGGSMLFGYNVFIGLKTETAIDDVFAVHGFSRDGEAFRFDAGAALPGLLDDPVFQRDFAELYRYYRETHLLQLRRLEGLLLAVFQTGARADDLQGAALEGRRRRLGVLRRQPRRARPRVPAVARLRVDADHP